MDEFFKKNQEVELGEDIMKILEQFEITVEDPTDFDQVRENGYYVYSVAGNQTVTKSSTVEKMTP